MRAIHAKQGSRLSAVQLKKETRDGTCGRTSYDPDCQNDVLGISHDHEDNGQWRLADSQYLFSVKQTRLVALPDHYPQPLLYFQKLTPCDCSLASTVKTHINRRCLRLYLCFA